MARRRERGTRPRVKESVDMTMEMEEDTAPTPRGRYVQGHNPESVRFGVFWLS